MSHRIREAPRSSHRVAGRPSAGSRLRRLSLCALALTGLLGVAGGLPAADALPSIKGREAASSDAAAAARRAGSTRRETRPPLPAARFQGAVREAYQVANDIPEVLDALRCHCRCARHSGHRSLLSCFVDEEAFGCGVCLREALMASALQKQGKRTAEIARQVDALFGRR